MLVTSARRVINILDISRRNLIIRACFFRYSSPGDLTRVLINYNAVWMYDLALLVAKFALKKSCDKSWIGSLL